MPLPFLIAGAAALAGATVAETAAVGVAAAVLTSDNKKKPEVKTTREQISASEVPDDVRRQIEGKSGIRYNDDVKYSPEQYYTLANEYYYGYGRQINRTTAKVFFQRAADAGHEAALRQLKLLRF